MGCDADDISECDCKVDSQSSSLKEIYGWCTGSGSQCCYDIGDNYANLGYEPTDSACRALNQPMIETHPLECMIPCSASFPQNCPVLSCDGVYDVWMDLTGGDGDEFVKNPNDPSYCCGTNNITCNEKGGPIHM
jgi:hypothetical protein